jgi:glucose/arabinose dehydrogenase
VNAQQLVASNQDFIMKPRQTKRALLTMALQAVVVLAIAGGSGVNAARASDVLAIGEESDSSVRFFDAQTGASLQQPMITPDSGKLQGPRGILFDAKRQEWLVVNQNEANNQASNASGGQYGEILRYDSSGSFLGALVRKTDPNAPFVPRGMALVTNKDGSRTLFVADMLGPQNHQTGPGRLLAYRVKGTQATFIANLDPNLTTPNTTEAFHPRGVVLGPDGYLYVSIRNLTPCGGSILRFDPTALTFTDVVLSNPEDCTQNANDLHRPEGLVFSPNGDLYVTSFRKDASDTDKALIIPHAALESGQMSLPLGRINWDQVGGPRRFAQALLFGPDGDLFVPLNSDPNPSLSQGEVRRYNTQTKTYSTFVPQGGGLNAPYYLSFWRTNPATLEYGY